MVTVKDKMIHEANIAKHGRNYGKENPFAGTEYESLWENNPYADLYYSQSFWDGLGLSNKAKDANSEYDRLYNEYIAGIYEQQRQDMYNSESEKVERMKQAGLNSDLQGLSNASESDALTPPNAGINPALNGQSPAMSAFGTITSVLGFATSTLQQINQIKGLSFDNTVKESDMFSNLMNLAHPHIINEYSRRFMGQEPNNWSDIADVSSLGMSRLTSKRYKKAFRDLLSSSQFSSAERAYKQLDSTDFAIQHYIQGMTNLQIKALKGDYNLRSTKGYIEAWRKEVYSRLYDDFKNGSSLAGLILIGSTGYPSIIQAAMSTDSPMSNRGKVKGTDSVLKGAGKLLGLW